MRRYKAITKERQRKHARIEYNYKAKVDCKTGNECVQLLYRKKVMCV
jgi:hypothetical protein